MTAPQPDREQEIRARAEAATPGPWELHKPWGPDFYAYLGDSHMRGVGTINFSSGEGADADMAFVLKAREDVDWLLARVAELRADRDAAVAAAVRRELEGIADDWSAHCPDHSTSAQTSMACRCDDANELRARAEGVREDAVASPAREQGEAQSLAAADVAAWLTKKAREYTATPKSRREDAADWLVRLASKVQRGAIRPAVAAPQAGDAR